MSLGPAILDGDIAALLITNLPQSLAEGGAPPPPRRLASSMAVELLINPMRGIFARCCACAARGSASKSCHSKFGERRISCLPSRDSKDRRTHFTSCLIRSLPPTVRA
jgi:hypothetical protein